MVGAWIQTWGVQLQSSCFEPHRYMVTLIIFLTLNFLWDLILPTSLCSRNTELDSYQKIPLHSSLHCCVEFTALWDGELVFDFQKVAKVELFFIWSVSLFQNYILLIMLLQLSQFSTYALHHPSPPLPQAIPSPLFTSISHVRKFFGYFISCTVLYILMAIL